MEKRRSPLHIVAIVVALSSLLLGSAIPSREGKPIPCPGGVANPGGGVVTADCGEPRDNRTPERAAIVVLGLVVAAGIGLYGRRLERGYEPLSSRRPGPEPKLPPSPLMGPVPPESGSSSAPLPDNPSGE